MFSADVVVVLRDPIQRHTSTSKGYVLGKQN